MTGSFVRVQRDNKWENIEIEYLTQDEREEFFSNKSHSEILNWIDLLCKNIVEVEYYLSGGSIKDAIQEEEN
jgi:hypothetical protein